MDFSELKKNPKKLAIPAAVLFIGLFVFAEYVKHKRAQHPQFAARPPYTLSRPPASPPGAPPAISLPGPPLFGQPGQSTMAPLPPEPRGQNAPLSPEIVSSIRRIVDGATKGRGQVKSIYPGPGGLIGLYWVTPLGYKKISWFSPDGTLLIPSSVFNANGVDLTDVANRKLNGLPLNAKTSSPVGRDGTVSPDVAKTLYFMGGKLPHFVTGHGSKTVYIFADPDCSVCHKFWEETGKTQRLASIHWILVGFIHPGADGSVKKAASIMASQHPAKAWAYNESHYDGATESGGAHIDPDADTHAITLNIDTLGAALHSLSSPTFVWLGKDGIPHAHAGLISDWSTFMRGVR